MSETGQRSIRRVVVVGASQDRLNTNSVLRGYVAEGFRKILGDENVRSCPMESAFGETLRFNPDLVLVFGSCMPDSSYYIALRNHCDLVRAPFVFWLHDDPYEFDFHRKIVPYADFIFSNDRFATVHYPKGNACWHLPLAASKQVHFLRVLEESEMQHDIFFCGVAFENRKQVISDLDSILREYKSYIVGPGWGDMRLPYCFEGNLSNLDFALNANRSKFVLNIGRHGDIANNLYRLAPSSPGPRTFEAALAGGLQLYYPESLEILDYFRASEEIFLFDSKKSLSEILLNSNEQVRRAMRIGSQKAALEKHTYAHRAQIILDQVRAVTAPSR